MRRTIGILRTLAFAAGLVASATVRAEDDDDTSRRVPQTRAPQTNARKAVGDDDAQAPTILDGVPAFSRLGELDRALQARGIHLYGVYLGDPYVNVAGGLRRQGTYAGRLDVELDANLEKLAGLADTSLHANMYQIHGRDISRLAIGNLLSSNDIAAFPTTRLYELYLAHDFGDRLSVRAGQIGIDVEFLTSNYAANFVDATFGWPGLPSLDLPDGGPAYPLAAPALRVRYEATDQLALLAAIFDGEPAGPGTTDPQTRDRYGLNFRVKDPPLVFAEAQYRYNQGRDAAGLPGTVKIGAFGQFGSFDDQRTGITGLPLAGSTGAPVVHSNDGGLYGIIDQQIYRASPQEPQRGIGVFARAIAAPADRNLVSLYLDAGFAALGIVPGRPDDFFGLAGAYAAISPNASAADVALNAAAGRPGPVRSFEAVLEATYSIHIVQGLALQPTAQYIIHPGGNVPNPLGTGAIHNAEVFGVTTTVRF